MHEAVALRPVQNLQDLIIGDVSSHIPVHAVFCHIADADAELAVDLTAAFVPHRLLFAAGALTDRILVILVEPVADMLHRDRLAFGFNRLFDRDNMHADTRASGRDHRGDAFQRHLGHQVEEGRKVGVLGGELIIHHHEFRRTRHKDRHIVLNGLGRVFPVGLDDTDPGQMIEHLLGILHRHAVHLGELFDTVRNSCLLERKHEFDFILGQNFIECPVFGIAGIQGSGIFLEIPVSDHRSELQNQLGLFGVSRNIVGILNEISFIEKTFFFFSRSHMFSLSVFPGRKFLFQPFFPGLHSLAGAGADFKDPDSRIQPLHPFFTGFKVEIEVRCGICFGDYKHIAFGKHQRIFQGFVISFRHRQDHHVFRGSGIVFRRADQIADILEEDKLRSFLPHLFQTFSGHARIHMAHSAGVNLDRSGAQGFDALGIHGAFDIRFHHRDADLCGKILNRTGQKCRLARARGRHQVDQQYALFFEFPAQRFGITGIGIRDGAVEFNDFHTLPASLSAIRSRHQIPHWSLPKGRRSRFPDSVLSLFSLPVPDRSRIPA